MNGFDLNLEHVVATLLEGVGSSNPIWLILEKCEIKSFKNFYKHTKYDIIALIRRNGSSNRSIALEEHHFSV